MKRKFPNHEVSSSRWPLSAASRLYSRMTSRRESARVYTFTSSILLARGWSSTTNPYTLALARRIKATVRASDTVARMGGDEFVVILQDVSERRDAEIVAQKLLSTLADPVVFKDKAFDVAASIGISLYPDDDKNIESLLQKADEAMYRTKKKTGNNFGFFKS